LIHLTARPAVLLERIGERGRPAEANVDLQYLEELGTLYKSFLANWHRGQILEIDSEKVDLRKAPQQDQLVARLLSLI
jgi:deoxyadenosine/deoxycytidine kinase